VDTRGVTASILYEAAITGGHLPELSGKYKLRITEITVAAAGYIGDHNHRGPGIRQMTTGEMDYIMPHATITYRPGDFFFETGDVSHRVLNKTSADCKHLLFEILPLDVQGPSLIPPETRRASKVGWLEAGQPGTQPTSRRLLIWPATQKRYRQVSVRLLLALAGALLVCTPDSGLAQSTDPAATSGRPFSPEAATQAYLDSLPAAERESSDAYFEGRYWLRLWNFLLVVGVNLGLLVTGASRRMRDLAERLVPFRPLQTLAYVVQYFIATTLVVLPLTIYEGFIREHQYGLSNQSFGSWFGDHAMVLGIGLLLGGLLVTALYCVVRRLPRTWALWGAIVTIGFVIFGALISPVFIDPLFNEYTRLKDPVVSASIQSLARAQGVPVEDVWVFNASRQTKRISANVSGFAGTMRISLNDNLLNRSSMAEIEAVMGHEIGHYVLNHVYKGIFFVGVVIGIGFALLKWLRTDCDRSGRDMGNPWSR
jgi:quercetin dioxygenase-like cupin family protein